jgi:hypothetical protein
MTTMTKTINTVQKETKVADKKNILLELVEVFSLWAIAATTILVIGITTWA